MSHIIACLCIIFIYGVILVAVDMKLRRLHEECARCVKNMKRRRAMVDVVTQMGVPKGADCNATDRPFHPATCPGWEGKSFHIH